MMGKPLVSSSPLRKAFERIRPRMTPALIIIGAQKSGTTALFHMLAKHPKSAPPTRKELDFFASNEVYTKGMQYYRSMFPPVPAKTFGHFTFEASPSYLYFAEKSAPRIAKMLPGVPCVALLRDPVKRAFSAWNMYRSFKGNLKNNYLYDARSFKKAIEDELKNGDDSGPQHYLSRGNYAEQIAKFKDSLGKDLLVVLSYKDFKRDPFSLVNDLFNLIGKKPLPKSHPAFQTNAGVIPYREKLDPGLAKELYQYYEPEREKLHKILGYDIDIFEGHG